MDGNKKKIPIIATVTALLIICAVLVVFFLQKNRIKATTMRLLRIVGEVTLEDGKKKKTILDNLRLNDGNALSTEAESLASVGLDDTKIISIEENSRAEFYQKGKKLELVLTKGRLFFDVQQPLADNESLDIKSSTMVVGIRGTSGYVWEDPASGIQYIYITDGHVTVNGYNPQTEKNEEVTVGPGQRVTAYLNDDGTFNTFIVEDVTEDDLPIALIRELFNNPDTLERVLKATGYDKNKLLKRILESDEALYIALDGLVLPELEPEPEPEASIEEPEETVTSTDKFEKTDTSSALVDETESSASSADEKEETPKKDQTTASVKPAKADPPAHVHEWVTEEYYTTEIETRTETETQYVTVQEIVDHPEVSHEVTKIYLIYPDGTEIGYDSMAEANAVMQAYTMNNQGATGGPSPEERTEKVVDTPAWQETVNRSVPQEVQVTRDYEVQVPHERTYCKTCGEEQN
jgi:hypothetical protein